MSADSDERLRGGVVLAYSSAALAQGLLPLIVGSWILYYYSPPEGKVLIAPATLGLVRLLERLFGAMFEPLAGHWSDRTRTRYGRRRPWMVVGAPILILSFVALWFPPQGLPTDDPRTIVHCAVSLMAFYLAYTAVFAPYNALLPELSRWSVERVRLSVWMSLFEVVASILASAGAGPLVGLGALTVIGISLANGFQLLALIAATLATVSLLPTIFFVPEKPVEEIPEGSMPFFTAVVTCFRNPAFARYGAVMLAFRFAAFGAIMSIPFLATQLMGVSEEIASYMLAIIILVATFAFPLVQRLANRIGKARVFMFGGIGFCFTLPLMGTIDLVPFSPVVYGAILFVLSGFSVATLFVLPRPLLADIIDDDELRVGQRREATFSGMSGVVEKIGEALATGAIGFLFSALGNSASEPLGLRLVGVVAASVLAAGLVIFRGYPLREVAK